MRKLGKNLRLDVILVEPLPQSWCNPIEHRLGETMEDLGIFKFAVQPLLKMVILADSPLQTLDVAAVGDDSRSYKDDEDEDTKTLRRN